ncbi:MAG: hypothetical protein GY777_12770 [Candidatus Brocadiaceae bacterium]|nr:hypothetical protein [Candidatus Brocadiaceae bacterium]
MFKSFEILPGAHALQINVMGFLPDWDRKEGMDTISFAAEIGHVYRTDGWVDKEGNAVTTVIDEETDIPVALER